MALSEREWLASGYTPEMNHFTDRKFFRIGNAGNGLSTVTALQAAWTILLARYTDGNDVEFHTITPTSRSASRIPENASTPHLATITVDWKLAVQDIVRQLEGRAQEDYNDQAFGKHNNGTTLLWIRSNETSPTGGQTLGTAQNFSLMPLCSILRDGLELHMAFDNMLVEKVHAERMVSQMGHILQQLMQCMDLGSPLKDLILIREKDLQEIWSWNADVPAVVEACVHDLIAETKHRQPDAPAVCAWDGELTYKQLDDLSTRLAQYLVGLGVGPEDIVPLCFEKSMWTPVAMLGVMKAGGASVSIDKNQPEGRLQAITSQVNAKIIISSQKNEALASRLLAGVRVVVVDKPQATHLAALPPKPLLSVSATNRLYVTFTSGSTGVPKGVIITHSNFSSAIRHQQAAFKLDSKTRFFDFAPYAFDTAWATILYTLTAGGCLCTPSDEELQEPERSMRDLRVNYAGMTPTVARMLRPERLPNLKTLVLGGEAVRLEDFERWSGKVSLVNAYGPSECTPTATIHCLQSIGLTDPPIGRPYGLCGWVVEPRGGGLMGVGEVGELWLEGPLVGSGYLNDPEKTAASFVKDPPWLLQGASGQPGRTGRLYRTGDLVRYRPDGSLEFVGRKDEQVKIRGQRVELREVEHHVQRLLSNSRPDTGPSAEVQVVAEVISLQGSNKPTLAAFVVPGSGAAAMTEEELSAAVGRMTSGLDERLATQLPSYMIPTS